jgi:uncharacterized membrane protein (DUF485 family)
MQLPVPRQIMPSPRWPWIMLIARTVLFFLFQMMFALILRFSEPWAGTKINEAGVWWPVSVTLTNLVCIFLLTQLFRGEGCRYWDIFRLDRKHIKGDLLVLLGAIVITGPVAQLPNTLLATALFGDALAPMRLFIQPLPMGAIYLTMITFPVTQALAELPTYFAYVMPRLAQQTGRPWMAYALASLFLGIQHSMIPFRIDGSFSPLRLDARFFIWRLLMFVPFAFFIGLVLKWRPRLLPYVVVIHALMDFFTMIFYLMPF